VGVVGGVRQVYFGVSGLVRVLNEARIDIVKIVAVAAVERRYSMVGAGFVVGIAAVRGDPVS
jgi:hypothetical protein